MGEIIKLNESDENDLCRGISFYSFTEDFSEIRFQKKSRLSGKEIKIIVQALAAGKDFAQEKIINVGLIRRVLEENPDVKMAVDGIKNYDEYTYKHSLNTAFYAMLIAKWLKFSEKQVKEIICAGLLHDIGKLKIPLDVLNKKEKITDYEYGLIKNHTIYGFNLIRDMEGINNSIRQAVLLHHERMDKSGYPFKSGLSDINAYAKIIAVADVYDAMCSDRVYKKRKSHFEAFRMFKNEGHEIFDAKILKVFLIRMPKFLIGMDVLLSDGEIGTICEISPDSPEYPLIKTSHGLIAAGVDAAVLKII
jgi:putative nucleotidyltransferase with HDIG domain